MDSAAPTMIESTAPGLVMGTPGYMSPEQVRGEEADHRSDIFSFGAILYEMLCGQRAFKRETVAETLTAILKEEPQELIELNPNLSPALERIVRRCLEKRPDDRFQSAKDLAFALEGLTGTGTTRISQAALEAASTKVGLLSSRHLGWAVAALTLVGSALMLLWLPQFKGSQSVQEPRPVRRYVVNLGAAPLARGRFNTPEALASPIALSPDGKWLAYAIVQEETTRLAIRGTSQLEVEPVPGTEGALRPFFSADNRWVGYWNPSKRKLMKVSVGRERPVEICDVRTLGDASWGDDDRIVFGGGPDRSGLWRVSASGGTPERLTTPDPATPYVVHATPCVLPGSKAVLFTLRILRRLEESLLAVLSLETGAAKNWIVLAKGAGNPRYSPTGHLIYAQQGKLMAMPFDAVTLKATGEPKPVTQPHMSDPNLFPVEYAFSQDGLFAYLPSAFVTERNSTFVLVSSNGTEVEMGPVSGVYDWARLSPDEKRVALHNLRTEEVSIYDIATDAFHRLPRMGELNKSPVWSPDGTRLAFVAREINEKSSSNWIYQVPIDGSRPPERVGQARLAAGLNPILNAWTPNGSNLIFTYRTAANEYNIGIVPLNGTAAPRTLLDGKANERDPAVSPDGNWLAYQSDETSPGRSEVYVDRFPQLGLKRPVSNAGGYRPVWARDGKELYFVQTNALVALPVVSTAPLIFGKQRELFSLEPYGRGVFDVGSGGRFLFIKPETTTNAAPTELVFVENWFEELKGTAKK